MAYRERVPRLWSQTIDAHRSEVRDAILDAAGALASERGPLSVTMTQIAEATGIGRATLYKYFPDVESIFVAWHGRHVAEHLEQISAVAGADSDVETRLRKVLETYARIRFRRPRNDLAALVHHGGEHADGERQLTAVVERLLAEAVSRGRVRDDVPVSELALYCLHALTAAEGVSDETAATRLADVTLDALRRRRKR